MPRLSLNNEIKCSIVVYCDNDPNAKRKETCTHIKSEGGYGFYASVLLSNYKDTIAKQQERSFHQKIKLHLSKECADFLNLDLPRPNGEGKQSEIWDTIYTLGWLEEKKTLNRLNKVWTKTNNWRKNRQHKSLTHALKVVLKYISDRRVQIKLNCLHQNELFFWTQIPQIFPKA